MSTVTLRLEMQYSKYLTPVYGNAKEKQCYVSNEDSNSLSWMDSNIFAYIKTFKNQVSHTERSKPDNTTSKTELQ